MRIANGTEEKSLSFVSPRIASENSSIGDFEVASWVFDVTWHSGPSRTVRAQSIQSPHDFAWGKTWICNVQNELLRRDEL